MRYFFIILYFLIFAVVLPWLFSRVMQSHDLAIILSLVSGIVGGVLVMITLNSD